MFEFRAVHYFEHAQNAHKCSKLFIIIYCKNFTDLNLLDLPVAQCNTILKAQNVIHVNTSYFPVLQE